MNKSRFKNRMATVSFSRRPRLFALNIMIINRRVHTRVLFEINCKKTRRDKTKCAPIDWSFLTEAELYSLNYGAAEYVPQFVHIRHEIHFAYMTHKY